jgi:hypothetical protein
MTTTISKEVLDELLSGIENADDLLGNQSLVLPRFSSGLFRAMFAMKEIRNGKEIHKRVSA